MTVVATSPVRAELLRQFCLHHRCSGVAGPALAARDAIAAACDAGPELRHVTAIRLRDWAAILTATAEQMETRA